MKGPRVRLTRRGEDALCTLAGFALILVTVIVGCACIDWRWPS